MFTPKKPVVIELTVHSVEVQPIINQIIQNPDIKLNSVDAIISVTKEQSSILSKYEIEYATTDNNVSKLVVTTQNTDSKIVFIDERPITVDFVANQTTVVQQTIDEITKAPITLYPSLQTFTLDTSSQEITTYIAKNIPESVNYTIESVRV